MKQKILVTGGGGYIGSHTIVELLQAGYDVVSIDNFSHSAGKSVFSNIKVITGVQVRNYAIDACDIAQVSTVFKKEKNITGVIHFAAFKSVGESVNEPLKYFNNNINSLLSVVASAQKFGVKLFVFSSSCSVCGAVSQLPVSEATPFGTAESPYARTKQIGEMILEDIARSKSDMKILALRYFNPVGAHESAHIGEEPIGTHDNLAPIITEVAAGVRKQLDIYGNDYDTRDGTAVRDYVHVSDIAEAHVLALRHLAQKKTPGYDVINLGTGKGVTVLAMVQAFQKATKMDLNYVFAAHRKGDIPAVYSDTRKAKKLLGWKPKRSIKDMMSSAWQWQVRLQRRK